MREELELHRELLARDLQRLTSFLYQVRPTDPTALGGAVLLLTVVALIATLAPMRRALQVDPMDALRAD